MEIFMGVEAAISTGLNNGFIDCNLESLEKYNPKLIINNYKEGVKVLTSLEAELINCIEFSFSVAFITESGVQVLLNILSELKEKNIKGRIITSQYQNFTEPKALRRLLEFGNVELRIVTEGNFHAKGYIFKKEDESYSFIIGSSNLTQNALCMNKEWNIRLSSLENGSVMQNIISEYDYNFINSTAVTKDWIDQYEKIYSSYRKARLSADSGTINLETISPNEMQKRALNNLERLRVDRENKALLISATGTGKTYLSAFDVAKFQPKKMLFIVHREQILKDAQKSYKKVLGYDKSYGYITGNKKEFDADYIFSTIQTMSKLEILQQFSEEHFEYICIDETHRSGANSYKKILNYFKPKFLLGMTATPERNDGYDVYSPFDHNIAYEIRLKQALEENFICPFHYYGVNDLEIGGEVYNGGDFNLLDLDARVNHMIDNIEHYGCFGDRVHGLVFCSNKIEARTLSDEFNKRGYNTIALTGEDSQSTREESIKRLEQKDRVKGLDYIFTIDIFSEGVDIPKINQIVMVRPTESAIVFVQQLGRGLRKIINKEYLVVIDFIGNYQKNFLIPIALTGDRSYNKDSVRRNLVNGNRTIPGCSTINFDSISKKRIFEAIEQANFHELKLLKDEYKNLKFMLGRIPKIIDFEEHASIDIMRILEKMGSYHNFLSKYEDEYDVEFDDTKEGMLKYVSTKMAEGKRDKELIVMNELINYNSYKFSESNKFDNMTNMLTNNFKTGTEKMLGSCVFIKKQNDKWQISDEFKDALRNDEFKKQIAELIDLGFRRNKEYYSNKYMDTEFSIYSKYTYHDVCRLLNWEKSVPPQNIGGYKYDAKTNTFPVFINYDKDEHIGDTIKYEDRFINPSKLIAISKSRRTSKSKEIKRIYASKDNGMKIYLFVRKNKNDKGSKEFYFMGEMVAIGEPKDFIMPNTDKTAVEITYELVTPIKDELYSYICN
ncbi:MAG TPA: DEAD/DEAH box helicase [Anaerovoracaceae bacterium]|nr:DEAD/DEAH box helicase [Anaerovoracaceae bacterium]